MWSIVAVVLFALLAMSWFIDHHRSRRERAQLRQTISRLSDQTRQLTGGEKSRQQTLFDGMSEGVLVTRPGETTEQSANRLGCSQQARLGSLWSV